MGPLGRQEMLQFVGGETLGIDHAAGRALIMVIREFNAFPLIKPDQLFHVADLLGLSLAPGHLGTTR